MYRKTNRAIEMRAVLWFTMHYKYIFAAANIIELYIRAVQSVLCTRFPRVRDIYTSMYIFTYT